VADFVNRRHFTIDWAYCDPAGIVFNSRFFEFFDTSAWMLFEAALGVKPQDMSAIFDILGVPLVDARAKFIVPAKFGDVVEMQSWIGEFRRSSFEVRHQLFVDGKLGVDGSETRVWAMLDPDSGHIRTKPIPQDVMDKFRTP
jgi:4-hydroxybenzoyl-CoA thioesterase